MRALHVFSISLVVGPTRCLLISYVIMTLPLDCLAGQITRRPCAVQRFVTRQPV